MNNAAATESPIISTRRTFDGVTVYLHADGAVSDRMSYIGRVKLPVATMWRAWEDVCTYEHTELRAFIKAVRDGTWTPVRIRPDMTEERHQAILATQVRTCGFGPDGVFRRWL
jgi:hypothetical protein